MRQKGSKGRLMAMRDQNIEKLIQEIGLKKSQAPVMVQDKNK